MATVKGHSYSDVLTGTDNHDDIFGYGGDDVIFAGASDDYIEPGAGNDVIFGGDGNDTISYLDKTALGYPSLPSSWGVDVDLASGTTHCLAAGPTFGTLVNETDTFYSIENVTGSNYDDHLAGDGGVNWLIGWGGNDHLEGRGGTDFLLGLDGDDLLEGGSGADQMDGGSGIDTADYSASSADVNVTLVTGKGYNGDAAGDTLYNIENLTGSAHDDQLRGDDNANVLYGGGGNDSLKGGGGADTLNGGAGIDTADYSDSPIGVYVKLAGYALTGYGFNGTASGDKLIQIENLNGSSYGDMLEGDDYTDNVLKGGGCDDVLQGHAGADTLDGGDGNDTAIYGGSTAGVTVFLSSGVGHGGDAEGDHLYNIENLRGSNYDDTFWGDDNANVLEGLAGKDQLKGAGGTDTLIGGMGADVMTGGAGGDTFVWESIAETGIASSDMDTIKDFNAAEGDKINLHAIDANTTIAGNQDFTFIETSNFSAPGQIRYFNDGVDTYIVMNRDSVLVDDAAIRISGVHTVDASWFVL